MLDLTGVRAHLKSVVSTLNHRVGSQSANNGVALEVTEQLRSLSSLNVVQLSKLAIPEQSMASTAINALNVHAKSHNDLVITIGTGIVFDSDFDGFV